MTLSRCSSLSPLLLALALAACGGGGNVTQGEPDAGVAPDGGEAGSGSDAGGSNDAGTSCTVAPVIIDHDGTMPTADAVYHVLDTSKHPLAVCNDGTPGTFIFRPGVGNGKKRWIVYLEGGGQCGSDPDCADRWQTQRGLMSSMSIHEGDKITTLEGIKSTDAAINPDFYDASFVQVPYCSSDAWSGDKAGDPAQPTSDVRRWHFRGRQIVDAVVTEVLALGMADADEVFLMGSSAGGYGTVMNADDIAPRLPTTTRYVAMIDAGFFIDYPSYDVSTKTESTMNPTLRALGLAIARGNWGGRGDASCEAVASDDLAKLRCSGPADVIVGGHVATPLFIRQSQLDAVQMKSFITVSQQDAPANAFRERVAAQIRTLLMQTPASTAVFSPHDKEHGIVNDNAEWHASAVGNLTVTQAIGAWYRDPCGHAPKDIQIP